MNWNDFFIKHFALTILLWAGSFLVARSSAAMRHGYWLVGFVWIALLPIFVWKGPSLPVERAVPYHMSPAKAPQPTTPLQGQTIPVSDSTGKPVQVMPQIEYSEIDFGPWINGIFAAGAVYGLGRFAIGLWSLFLIRRRSQFAQNQTLDEAADALGLRRSPDLLVSSDIQVPMTFGWLDPVVLIPKSGTSYEALLHECAHISRGDWAGLLLARFVRAIYWFNPLVHLAEIRLAAETEASADDVVLLAGVSPVSYANQLVEIAATLTGQAQPVAISVVGRGALKARIAKILGTAIRHRRCPFRPAVLTITLAGASAIGLAAIHYSSQPTTADGVLELPNGEEVRIVAITKKEGDHWVSWNMRGERLARPIWPDEFALESLQREFKDSELGASQRRYVVLRRTLLGDGFGFTTSEDLGGQKHADVGLDGLQVGKNERIDIGSYRGTLSFTQMNARGKKGRLHIWTPTQGDWSPIIPVTHDGSRLATPMNDLFAQYTRSASSDHWDISGRVPLRFATDQWMLVVGNGTEPYRQELAVNDQGQAMTTFMDSKGPTAILGFVHRPTAHVRLDNIPLEPLTREATEPMPVPMSVVATNGKATLPDGSRIEFLGLFEHQKQSWSPSGSPVSLPKQLTQERTSSFLTSLSPHLRLLNVVFQYTSRDGGGSPLGVYDCLGTLTPGSVETTTPTGNYFMQNVLVSSDAKAMGLTVRAISKSSAIQETVPLKPSDMSPQGAQKAELEVTVDANEWSPVQQHLGKDRSSEFELLDSRGNVIPYRSRSSSEQQGRLDLQFFLLKPGDANRAKTLRITSWPIYSIQFSNVALQPK